MNKTKGQLEAEISKAIIKLEKETIGRGPLETKTFIIEDMILVRLKGVLTKLEKNLAAGGSDYHRGRELIKKTRAEILENNRPLYEIITSIINKKIVSMHTDISTVTGERIIFFTLDDIIHFS